MNKKQAARLGGKATFRKHGAEHMREIGRRGAQTFWRRYHLEPCDLADFAIVERATGRVVNLLYNNKQLKAAQAIKKGNKP